MRVELLAADGYPEETGETFLANARGKALYGREVGPADAWMLGEDSGLEVDALGGAPGVQTARWAEGRHVESILEALAGETDRRARYVCELVALTPDGRELRGAGTLEGRIAKAPNGTAGFGFDPVFVPDGEERTVAELGDAWKAEHSHRARAARALRDELAEPTGRSV
jgi:XTP/dITP diphosphohydrolase